MPRRRKGRGGKKATTASREKNTEISENAAVAKMNDGLKQDFRAEGYCISLLNRQKLFCHKQWIDDTNSVMGNCSNEVKYLCYIFS